MHVPLFIWKCSNLLFIYACTLPVLGDKYLQWVAVHSVFMSRLPNHAQHVNTHLIISHWVFGLMRSHWTWVGPTPTARHSSALQWCERDGKTKTKNSLRKRLTFTEARMQLNFCWRILCILLPEAKKGSMAGCSAKRGSRKKDTCVLGRKAASGLTFWPSSLKVLIILDQSHFTHIYVLMLLLHLCKNVQS